MHLSPFFWNCLRLPSRSWYPSNIEQSHWETNGPRSFSFNLCIPKKESTPYPLGMTSPNKQPTLIDSAPIQNLHPMLDIVTWISFGKKLFCFIQSTFPPPKYPLPFLNLLIVLGSLFEMLPYKTMRLPFLS